MTAEQSAWFAIAYEIRTLTIALTEQTYNLNAVLSVTNCEIAGLNGGCVMTRILGVSAVPVSSHRTC
ncbi:hypothetical protein SAMN04488548_12051 [Gordonia westfalica]|uniref:Uncharacterized protein n=1 Tax=Gordonia westfalica TaxID=158898 RepID=A0A1H2DSA4_9ACTN|nr:hypothetical protein SAMN04488548_12051 [Gordonia westfalica]